VLLILDDLDRGSRAGLQRGVGKWGTMAQCPQFMAMLVEKTNGFWTLSKIMCWAHLRFTRHCSFSIAGCIRSLVRVHGNLQDSLLQSNAEELRRPGNLSGHRFYKATLKVISLGLNAQDVAKG